MPVVYTNNNGERTPIEIGADAYQELTGIPAPMQGNAWEKFLVEKLAQIPALETGGEMPSAPGVEPGYKPPPASETWKRAISTGIDFMPGPGDVKGATEAITGEDLITGEPMKWWQRGLAGAGALPFLPNVAGIVRDIKGGSRLYDQYLSKMKSEGRIPTLTEKDFAQFENPVGKTPIVEDNLDLAPLGKMDRMAKLKERFPDLSTSEAMRLGKQIEEEFTGSRGVGPLGSKFIEPRKDILQVGGNPTGPNEARYLKRNEQKSRSPSRLTEAPDLLSTIRSLQRPGQPRELVSISQLRDKAVGGTGGIRMFHGGEKEITQIDTSMFGKRTDPGFFGEGFYAVSDKANAERWGKAVTEGELNLKKPLEVTGMSDFMEKTGMKSVWNDKLTKEQNVINYAKEVNRVTEKLKSEGYDGVLYKRSNGTIQATIFYPEGFSIGKSKGKMTNEEFDAQLLKLAQEGKVALHEHDFAYGLKPEARAKLLAIDNPYARWGKTHYVGVVPK